MASNQPQQQLCTTQSISSIPTTLSPTDDKIIVPNTEVEKSIIDDSVVLRTPSKKQREVSTVTPSYSTNRKNRPPLTVVTPLSSKSKCCGDCNVCAVCLSPMLSSSRSSKLIVETRCKHLFHDSCLQLTKQRKAVCPCCRTPVTPLTSTQKTELDDSFIPPPPGERPPLQPGSNHTNQSYSIAETASRVREALRYLLFPSFSHIQLSHFHHLSRLHLFSHLHFSPFYLLLMFVSD